jgi:hypothetical protein
MDIRIATVNELLDELHKRSHSYSEGDGPSLCHLQLQSPESEFSVDLEGSGFHNGMAGKGPVRILVVRP